MLEQAILFARDPEPPAPALVGALHSCGLSTVSTSSPAELVKLLTCSSPECLVILAVPSLGDDEGFRLAEEVRSVDHHCSLLMVTTFISTERAVRAMRAGASDLVEDSATTEMFVATITGLATRHRECRSCQQVATGLMGCSEMVGTSTAIKHIRAQIARIAPANANVLLTGESGTGKELVAELIHQHSRRGSRPFVAVNCAAVPDTLLESELFGYERGAFTGAHVSRDGKLQHAAGGTLFLDEVGDMSMVAQAKILRAVDSRVIQRLGSNVDTRVQVRIIAATNQNLEGLIEEKRFRQDLYYRLNVVRLSLPPLRERLEDIPDLVNHMIGKLDTRRDATSYHVDGDVMHRLQHYHWPGNVRELRNVLESILVFARLEFHWPGRYPGRTASQAPILQTALCR